jgi:hypothetical protein
MTAPHVLFVRLRHRGLQDDERPLDHTDQIAQASNATPTAACRRTSGGDGASPG